jgi:CMP-N-acetylneuraminic acid synthetase
MEVLAIIPARGGSKGVPRKNVRHLCGKPLVAWMIESALAAKFVSRVVVSTDDAEVAAISRDVGAQVIPRPIELAGDLSSSESALLHALDYLKQTEGYQSELVVFLQCTAPLTLPEDIDNTVQTLLEENADSVLTVTPFHYFLWQCGTNGGAVGINHDKGIRLPRQQGEPQYLETGAVYVMRAEGFIKAKHRFFGKTVMHVIPPERCLEIDDLQSVFIAEALLSKRKEP